jgi:amidase
MHQALVQSATDAARMLHRWEISSRELTQMRLPRIDAVNPALNAVVELRREAALQQAGGHRGHRRRLLSYP